MPEFKPRPAQSKVLAYTGGKMGISAVPGSGKTHTLSALAAKLMQTSRLNEEQEILIVTLVNSAVDNFEIRIREFLRSALPFGYRVRTLHGLANDIVREKPAAVGLENRFSIIDEREAEYIRREASNSWLQAHPYELDTYLDPANDESKRDWLRKKHLPELVHDIALAFIRTAKDNRLSPEKLRSLLEQTPTPMPLAQMGLDIYQDYQRALIYRGAVDFDDLIRLALDLLENDREYLERLRFRWPYILEDEAQDSSELQEQILRLLAGPNGNWVRVGDPNQAIFETFTTASPRHLIDFIHQEADQHNVLPNSGRCQPTIIALANQLITWVANEHPEPQARDSLTVPYILPTPPDDPQPNPPDDPGGIKLSGKKFTPEEEVEAVAKSLAKWLPENPQATVAVLVPRNQRGADVIGALKQRKIECVEYLSTTAATRLTSDRLGAVLSHLSDPQSSVKLSKAYEAWREMNEEDQPAINEQVDSEIIKYAASLLRKCQEVEAYISPSPGRDWFMNIKDSLESQNGDISAGEAVLNELEQFRQLLRRWQAATSLPIDQMVLAISQDLFSTASELALAYKLALILRQAANDHFDWRLPELNNELGVIARNERRFIGFSQDDSGFDPDRHRGKVVVSTMHKAKGLEWDRVYLMSVNNYDFPSGQPNDAYIAEKWFLRNQLNLGAETLEQLKTVISDSEYEFYQEGMATSVARLDYVRERLRLLYVGITRARKELILTWNTGRQGNQTPALPFSALQGWLEGRS
jgi:DNA helicase II / ATP-dependent DNA helicase PcrA